MHRGRIWVAVAACVCVLGGTVACGGKKPADDPSSSKPADDSVKWEGASSNPSSSSSSSGGGSSSGGSSDDPGGKPASGQTASGGAVREAPKTRTDQYDKDGTEVALKRAARQVKENCGAAKDDNGKAIGPWGKVTIQVQLGHNGHSKGTTVPSPYQGKPAGNCIEKAFTNLQFPPWNGADAQVDWDLELIEPKK